MISSIANISEANEIIISRLKNNNPEILPLDRYTHHAITSDRFDVLRSITEGDYEESVKNYIETAGEIHAVSSYAFSGFTISDQEAENYIVYPFSRVNLYKSIYSDVLPSVFNLYFNTMKKLEKLRQFGTGVGKGLLINITSFTKKEFESLNIVEYKDVVDLMLIVSEQIAKQNTDIEYLLQKIEEITKEKEALIFEVERLNETVINTSITTWR